MSEQPSIARPLRLLRLEIRTEQDLVLARQRVRQIAEALQFQPAVQTRITTALSEIVRNAYQYAGGGSVEFAAEMTPEKQLGPARQSLVITVADRGPGLKNQDFAEGRATASSTGLGLGLLGARRLMDRFEVQTSPAGTVITMRKILPPGVALRTPVQLQAIVDQLANQLAASPVEELQIQNQELLLTLDELRNREHDLAQVNQELSQTNSGVLALYDELETLHRVGLMVAERHDLEDLLQTIIDATTDLTGADIGAFYYRQPASEKWRQQGVSGRHKEAFDGLPSDYPMDFFGTQLVSGVSRIADVHLESENSAGSQWVALLAARYPIRSWLFVPVLMTNSEPAGAMIFGHSTPDTFTERSERIVSAISVQAAVGIEKARLFRGLETASEAKDRFLAMLSHELRTPLNPVSAILSALGGDPDLPEKFREDVTVMRRNVDLEARLIDDLLDFNRIIRGKLQIDHSPNDVHLLINAVVDICEPDLANGEHPLLLNLAAERSIVSGDAARLQQVLWNLLKNAIKFTPAHGEIAITTSLDGPEGPLRIVISDAGAGIEPDVLPLIFSAFDQGGLPHGRYGGLGLGLAIAKTFMELHGGEITASSAGLGKGAQFTLLLPLLVGAVPDAPPVSPNRRDDSKGVVCRRVLLVDDHHDTLAIMARLLSRRGHVVATATTSTAALDLAKRETFDILISDLGLPDRSGLVLIAEVHRLQRIPAIAISGYGMEGDLANSRAAGFDRHITKPVNFELLEQAISELCC